MAREKDNSKSGSGKAMTGQRLWEAARDGDAAKVRTLLSTQGAQSFIKYQGADGITPLPRLPSKEILFPDYSEI